MEVTALVAKDIWIICQSLALSLTFQAAGNGIRKTHTVPLAGDANLSDP